MKELLRDTVPAWHRTRLKAEGIKRFAPRVHQRYRARVVQESRAEEG